MQRLARMRNKEGGAQFTGFTGTKVQILTLMRLSGVGVSLDQNLHWYESAQVC
jgi:hypothetical protein